MNRIALLIGSDHDGLRGVIHDLAAMTTALRARGFDVRDCPPARATRAGMLAAYEKLIADAGPDDAVVVYYTGHGGSAEPPEPGPPLQYIVPIDYDKSAPGDFRGIASAELSVLQTRLTEVTHNVTVILDCCHSGLMSRDVNMRRKSVQPAPYAEVRAHLDRLSLRADLVPTESNEYAVRIVACSPEQRAYEQPDENNVWRGVLTDWLTRALAEAGDEPVTWAALVDQIRYQVIGQSFEQRPEAEGPAGRVLFTTERPHVLPSLPVTSLGPPDRVRLDGAALLRVQRGDEFMIMPPGRAKADKAVRVGDLTIDHVADSFAEGDVAFAPGKRAVPAGARAFRTRVTAPQIVVRVPAGLPPDVLAAAPLARPAGPGEKWTLEIHVDASGGVVLRDHIGPLHPPYAGDPDGYAKLAQAVMIFAQATQVRRLIGDRSFPLDVDIEVEWGLVADGRALPPPEPGRRLLPGECVYVTVHNRDYVPVYVSMLDIGLSGRISRLMRGTPSGKMLPAHHSYTFGRNEAQQVLAGAPLSWPDGLDPRYARTETIVVVVHSTWLNLAVLEQPEIAQTRSPGTGSPLRDMIDQIAVGCSRTVAADWSTDFRYEIRGIDFEMGPSAE